MAEQEEVLAELEALEAVYGDDCTILCKYPPIFHLRIKPRTADVTSQQFVEAIISIQAGPQEAVERLSSINHPDGNCPLCLYPLVDEEKGNSVFPFMKLMSCFHCFHCECILRWYNWLQHLKETDVTHSVGSTASPSKAEVQQESKGNCPVCRKVFLAKDIEHVHGMVGMQTHWISDGVGMNDQDMILHCDFEKIRRNRFDAILKIQEQKGGLIEAETREVVRPPGVYLLQRSTVDDVKEPDDQQHEKEDPPGNSQTTSSSNGHAAKKNFTRRHKPRKQVRQWVKK
ncbi:unnamed protein product [Cuscuta epithymum]|uniref:RING-type domain-containing protein n=1 Tax=Cuscuta epithymum TaxID=186058 RepID=A0AAV0EY28_9ASTE|nr:unnamed protein product [Cuscuta epithymum]CAH9128103.1 unnamed protein product [Cuscuta epithymum]